MISPIRFPAQKISEEKRAVLQQRPTAFAQKGFVQRMRVILIMMMPDPAGHIHHASHRTAAEIIIQCPDRIRTQLDKRSTAVEISFGDHSARFMEKIHPGKITFQQFQMVASRQSPERRLKIVIAVIIPVPAHVITDRTGNIQSRRHLPASVNRTLQMQLIVPCRLQHRFVELQSRP